MLKTQVLKPMKEVQARERLRRRQLMKTWKTTMMKRMMKTSMRMKEVDLGQDQAHLTVRKMVKMKKMKIQP